MTSASNGRGPTMGRPWRGATAAVYVMLIMLLSLAGLACGERSVAPSPPPPPAPPPPPPSASLAIEDLSFVVLEGPCSYYYGGQHRCFRPIFVLREIGGASGATIQEAHLEGPDGAEPGFIAGPACPHNRKVRVPPGGTSHIFHSNAGNSGPDGYCELWMDLLNSAERRQFELIIAFTNDAGVRRTFRTWVDVP